MVDYNLIEKIFSGQVKLDSSNIKGFEEYYNEFEVMIENNYSDNDDKFIKIEELYILKNDSDRAFYNMLKLIENILDEYNEKQDTKKKLKLKTKTELLKERVKKSLKYREGCVRENTKIKKILIKIEGMKNRILMDTAQIEVISKKMKKDKFIIEHKKKLAVESTIKAENNLEKEKERKQHYQERLKQTQQNLIEVEKIERQETNVATRMKIERKQSENRLKKKENELKNEKKILNNSTQEDKKNTKSKKNELKNEKKILNNSTQDEKHKEKLHESTMIPLGNTKQEESLYNQPGHYMNRRHSE